jgi:hypothetical protein
MQPNDPYTYIFKFSIGKKGENRIVGECEFDTDKKTSFLLKESSQPLSAEALSLFQEYMNLLKKIYDTSGGLRLVSVYSKDAKENKEVVETASVKDKVL